MVDIKVSFGMSDLCEAPTACNLVPGLSACVKSVWCSEQHFLSHGDGAKLGFDLTNQITDDLIIFA